MSPLHARARALGTMPHRRGTRVALLSLLLVGALGLRAGRVHAVRPAAWSARRDGGAARCSGSGDGDDGGAGKGEGEGEGKRSVGERLNALLDAPIIDPGARDSADQPKLLRDFQQLITDDYPMAEALYAGSVFAVLLFFAQQGVRIYKHCYFMPDKLCPWAPSAEDLLNF